MKREQTERERVPVLYRHRRSARFTGERRHRWRAWGSIVFFFFFMKKKINLGIFQRREENSFLVIQACQIEDSDFTHAAKML